MSASKKREEFGDDPDVQRITETWLVSGLPIAARDNGSLPAIGDAHGTIAACKVVSRSGVPEEGRTGNSIYTITYSDSPAETLEVDSDATVRVDMMGRTERQYVDLDDKTKGIGVSHEGAEVNRPYVALVYEHLESTVSKTTIEDLCGRTNNALWKGYAENELKFIGALLTQQGDSKIRVSYHFIKDVIRGTHKFYWSPYTEVPGKIPAVVGPPAFDEIDIIKRKYSAEQNARVCEQGDFTDLPF